jgi:DNA-binding NarL/FixJ family response regulator
MSSTGAPGLVVADERGDAFMRLRSLDLGTAIWRVMRAPGALDLPESTVVVYVAYDTPSWDVIRQCAVRYATIVLAVHAREEDRLTALRAGAFGYVDLAMPREGLRRTMLGALRGEPAFSRDVMGIWLREGRVGGRAVGRSPHAARLTARQREIVALIAAGSTDKEIGTALGIRTATAQKHVANLLRRLGVSNRAAAVGVLFKEGDLPDFHRSGTRRR